jgi:uncharacterized membrane protein
MAHASNSVSIQRPANVVYDFILDGTKNPRWRPAVIDVKQVPGKPAGVGAVYKQGVKGPGGRRIDADYEIIECTPDESIKFQVIAGPARPVGLFRLARDGNATSVTFTLDYQPKGLAKLMDPMITRTMQSEVGTLANLKAYLEEQNL